MRMKPINGENPDIFVARQVSDALPEVLVNYLCGLMKTDREAAGNRHVFKLCKEQLGSFELQDIIHIGENGTHVSHRVFGFRPIEAEIIIVCDRTGYHVTVNWILVSTTTVAA